ncbi:MAG: DUF4040 domain-containing protein [Clostridia bacterium]|nr:DUF4040 domain-containing protein [Clostridia bacterium]
MEQVFLLSLVLFAILAIQTHTLRHAVIYLSIYSLGSSVLFLVYGAPDVALAEAIIGSGLSVVFYLVALKRQRLMTIFLIEDGSLDPERHRELARLLREIEHLYAKKELQSHVFRTDLDRKAILSQRDYDLLVAVEKGHVWIYGGQEDYQMDTLALHLASLDLVELPVELFRLEKGAQPS